MSAQWWKMVAIALLAVMLGGGGAGAALWWAAAAARDQALAEVKVLAAANQELSGGIAAQNLAIGRLGEERAAAEERGLAAQRLAAANGKRFDGVLQQLAGVRPTACAETMPYVNQLLESVR